MRRKVVYRSVAIRAVILILAAIAILSVFPFRIWERTITESGGGDIVQTSDRVNDFYDVVQRFIAQYDRLESIDIYVDDVELGNYMSMVIYNENMEEVEIEGTELKARALLHEIDHLDGHLYVEKVEGDLMDVKAEEPEEEED